MILFQSKKKNKKEVDKESAIDELDRIRAEEEEDVRQRDELAARIRQRDKERTRNVVEKNDKKAAADAARRFASSLLTGISSSSIWYYLFFVELWECCAHRVP